MRIRSEMPYEQTKENEWIQPVSRGYKMACCDCGLVHDLDFRVKGGRAQFRVRRNNRSTGQLRRWNNIKVRSEG